MWPLIRAAEASVAQHGHCSRAGSAGTGLRSAHEYARRGHGQLELARAGGQLDAGDCRRLAALTEVTDRDNDPLGRPEKAESAQP